MDKKQQNQDQKHEQDVLAQPRPAQAQQQSEPKEVKDMERFSATRSVRAAKLKAVDRDTNGAYTLIPEDTAFAPVQLGPNESTNVKGFGPSDNTKDYGYVVIDDNGRREWMSSADFEALYKSGK